jgi:hypothetical protein
MNAQEMSARQSFGVTTTFAPNSSHIFIGDAEKRRVWTAGFVYDFRLWDTHRICLSYQGSLSPFFQERDPTLIGTFYTPPLPGGKPVIMLLSPQRVTTVNNDPVGVAGGFGGSTSAPVYPLYGSMKTYAVAIAPLGVRLNGFNSRKLQPTFSVDLGMVFSSRDLPIDNSSSSNFQFSFGPDVEYCYRRNQAARVEYVYRHLSNANTGTNNPGVDAGVFRLTLTTRHR